MQLTTSYVVECFEDLGKLTENMKMNHGIQVLNSFDKETLFSSHETQFEIMNSIQDQLVIF